METTLLLRAILSLIGIIGLIYGLSYLVRYLKISPFPFMRPIQGKRLKIIEQLRLSDKRELLLIQKDQTEFLIFVDGTGVHFLEKGEPLPCVK